MSTQTEFDLVIIGSGPAGLTAGIYAGRGGVKTALLGGDKPGGQLMLTSEVENYPGFAKGVLGPQLMEQMKTQAARFGVELIDQSADSLMADGSNWVTEIGNGDKLTSRAVIVATGASARWLGVPGEDKLKGKGVSACATCDGFFFRDKEVAVVGGGDTAMEEAHVLAGFARQVYIIHRRDAFRASRIMQQRVLNNPKVKVIWNSVVDQVLGDDKVEAVKLTNTITGEISQLEIDGLFVAIGHQPNTAFLGKLIKLDAKGYIITAGYLATEAAKLQANTDYQTLLPPDKIPAWLKQFNLNLPHSTSRSGIFAAGDVADYRYRQAVTAAGDGCMAALEVMEFLHLR